MCYFESGKKMAEGCFNEGVFSGKGVKFYENGNKRIEGEWVNGYKKFCWFIYLKIKCKGSPRGIMKQERSKWRGHLRKEN